jgi:hypothetical protein
MTTGNLFVVGGQPRVQHLNNVTDADEDVTHVNQAVDVRGDDCLRSRVRQCGEDGALQPHSHTT